MAASLTTIARPFGPHRAPGRHIVKPHLHPRGTPVPRPSMIPAFAADRPPRRGRTQNPTHDIHRTAHAPRRRMPRLLRVVVRVRPPSLRPPVLRSRRKVGCHRCGRSLLPSPYGGPSRERSPRTLPPAHPPSLFTATPYGAAIVTAGTGGMVPPEGDPSRHPPHGLPAGAALAVLPSRLLPTVTPAWEKASKQGRPDPARSPFFISMQPTEPAHIIVSRENGKTELRCSGRGSETDTAPCRRRRLNGRYGNLCPLHDTSPP